MYLSCECVCAHFVLLCVIQTNLAKSSIVSALCARELYECAYRMAFVYEFAQLTLLNAITQFRGAALTRKKATNEHSGL